MLGRLVWISVAVVLAILSQQTFVGEAEVVLYSLALYLAGVVTKGDAILPKAGK